MSAVVAEPMKDVVAFPSKAWFQRLADLMNANRARQEQLGYVDCVAQFTVLDGGPGGTPVSYQVTFEEFACTGVTELASAALNGADFALEAKLADWRTMIASIADGHGRPALEQTLNRLSHMQTPFRLVAEDVLRSDYYYRYNQSLQEFINASAQFTSHFGG